MIAPYRDPTSHYRVTSALWNMGIFIRGLKFNHQMCIDLHVYLITLTLVRKGICPAVAKLLVFMYTNYSLTVKWNSTSSECFSCSNGIKQGRCVLSLVLFCVYMDEPLNRLGNFKSATWLPIHGGIQLRWWFSDAAGTIIGCRTNAWGMWKVC